MVFNKLKQKILNSSDSYNYYKKKYNEHEKTIDSYNKLFNALYLNFELTPTPFLRNIRELGYQILTFTDNVCKKYDLQWWADGGTLLGSIRHQNYIPWDDDLYIAMMIKDYNAFIDVIDHEIEINNLTNVTATFTKERDYRWIQLHYKHPDHFEKKYSFVGLDIFPFDYLKDYHGQEIEDHYQDTRNKFYSECREGLDFDIVLKNYYERMNLDIDYAPHYISGVEGTRGPVNLYDLVVMDTDKLFPLKRRPFGPIDIPVPNDEVDYLIAQYGKNYLKIPRNIRDHGRIGRIRTIYDVMPLLDEAVEIFQRANKNFKFE